MREIVMTHEEIIEACKRIAGELEKKFKNSDSIPVFVCVLKGATNFFMDLIQQVSMPIITDYMQVNSYNGTSSTGVIHLKKDITENITGKDLVIVEDVVDTGLTLNYIKQYIQIKYNPRSITIVTLIDKKPLRKIDFHVDLCGVVLNENKFLCGYGFDYHELLRNVPYVYVPDKKEITELDKILSKDSKVIVKK